MAELESMYRQKLQLRAVALLWSSSSPAASRRLRKSLSAVELRRSSGASDSADGDEDATDEVGNGPLFSPKEHIKNMWRDFRLSREDGEEEEELWRHRLTVPKPFQMMLREAERQKRGVKSRAQIEQENAELRRRLEELTECQKKFRAAAVPAHVHLPLYEELRERKEERRRRREDQHPRSAQKPFSFLERERLKKEQKQLHPQQQPSDQEAVKPFKAKPVPKAVYAAASGEQMKEEQLYRSIKIQMRAQEMLHSASMPRSMLARYRRFQRHLEKQKGAKPTTACEPFELRTSRITSHRERILADIEKEQSSPRTSRWPYVSPGPARRATSSRCSSLSGSLELLPTKVTDASKKREEAVRYHRRAPEAPVVVEIETRHRCLGTVSFCV
uniref:Protein FAM161A n=1 Tax=Cyclopterus lumpus TaxID=8103 RepID=A0A8C2ZTJ2_CYCLU